MDSKKPTDLSKERDDRARKNGTINSRENQRRRAFESGQRVGAWVDKAIRSAEAESKEKK